MKVDRGKAATVKFSGNTHYFCSEHCLHAFEVDAEQHVPAGSTRSGTDAAHAH